MSPQQLVEPDRQVADPDPGGEVRSWWPRHDVAPVGGGTKHLHHPALGDVAFQHTVLQVTDHPEQMLVYFSTDEAPAAKLAALADGIG
jgi:MmyB-like transcription regulator ligand binding domain